MALGPEHHARLEANHARRLQELVGRSCLNIVKGLMKHNVRTFSSRPPFARILEMVPAALPSF